jgi:hypothetical protein
MNEHSIAVVILLLKNFKFGSTAKPMSEPSHFRTMADGKHKVLYRYVRVQTVSTVSTRTLLVQDAPRGGTTVLRTDKKDRHSGYDNIRTNRSRWTRLHVL